MVLLTLFAFLAGGATAISPCVLPVLPALLSAGSTGGRRRPLGIVLGLAVTFAITIIGLAKVVDGVGLGSSLLRYFAVAVLLVFGVIVAVPAIAARVEAPLSRLAALGPKTRGDGFWSGTLVGAALGFVYAPCAGPILAAVIAVSAASSRTVVVGIAYSLGSATVLLALALGGRRITERIRQAGRGPALQRALGVVMALTAIAIVTNLDQRFETAIAQHAPNFNLASGLEKSNAVKKRLRDLHGGKGPKFDSSTAAAKRSRPPAAGAVAGTPSNLPVLGRAPNFTGTQRWFNTPGGAKLSLAKLRGRVVLVDFWTYTCINCLRTLPYLKAWDSRYRDAGLTIVGVHTPEFSFEHDAGNVERAIAQNGIRYPVAQDNEFATWNAYGNQFWPAEYLIDANGEVRHTHFGEGEYDKTEAAIRSLLAERGGKLGGTVKVAGAITPTASATPETYLGNERAERWLPARPPAGTHTFGGPPDKLPLSHFAFGGTWRIGPQPATAVRNARIDATIQAKNLYLVLSSPGDRPRPVQVALDGKPLRTITVTTQRLYTLASLPRSERHRLTLRFAPGVAGYAFTFG